MTSYFISRHLGALDWLQQQSITVDHQLAHLEIDRIQAGDTVIGTLPINLVAELNARGARYLHLTLDLPAEIRGQELTAATMHTLGARLEAYAAQKLSN